jgi:hypothetical protein
MSFLPKYIKKTRESMVKTIEISDIGKYDILKYYDGIYTVRNVVEKGSDDLFVFADGQNMIPGYIDSSSKKTLSVLGNKKKLVVSIVNSFYHSLLDNMSDIIYAMRLYPKHELIIDISEIREDFENAHNENFIYHNVFLYFLESLKIKKIKYRLVRLKDYEIIYINNFYVVNYGLESIKKADVIYDFFKDRISNPSVKPHRKIFISRSLTVGREYDAPSLTCSNDDRVDDHKALDGLFESMGYEIVIVENLRSFQEQIDLFYEAKVIASITGSGLSNAAFMQPGQTLIEIVTPLVIPVGRPGENKDLADPYYVQELHNFYKNIAFYKNHTYFGIHNQSRSFEKLNNVIESDAKIKNFLERLSE